ncbi:hypothetical protein Hamer_G008795 [Homarus americanus]|uniref:Uncharacterized protein n=1 Tax=Homarus americanus TaxID=6706 RepID=A0A8J5MP24_HOMAM|nr:hypothetical protein Hamer_G008795 [Homarus americanus]
MRLDSSETFRQQSSKIVEISYESSLMIAKLWKCFIKQNKTASFPRLDEVLSDKNLHDDLKADIENHHQALEGRRVTVMWGGMGMDRHFWENKFRQMFLGGGPPNQLLTR